MNIERLSRLKQSPPERNSGGLLARSLRQTLEVVLGFLNRLFRKSRYSSPAGRTRWFEP